MRSLKSRLLISVRLALPCRARVPMTTPVSVTALYALESAASIPATQNAARFVLANARLMHD